jgi:hypothetical protein
MVAKRRKKMKRAGTGKNNTTNNARAAAAAAAKKNPSGSAVPITLISVRNTNKGPRIQPSSPGKRGLSGDSLENVSSHVKDNTMNGDMQRTSTTSNNTSSHKRTSSSSSSSSSSDEEGSETYTRSRRKDDKARDNHEQRGNETEAVTHKDIYNIVQGNMGANRNDKREGSQAFDVARDLAYSWMKCLDKDQYNFSNGIVASFISDQLNLFPEETPSMSNVVKENLRMGKHAWWFKINVFVRDAIKNSRAYACAKLRKGLRRK